VTHAVIDHLLSSKLHAVLTRPNEKVCYKVYTSLIMAPVVCITACPSLAVSNSSRLLTFSMDLFSYVRWTFFPPHWKFDGPIFRGLIFLVDVFTAAIFSVDHFSMDVFFRGRFYRIPIFCTPLSLTWGQGYSYPNYHGGTTHVSKVCSTPQSCVPWDLNTALFPNQNKMNKACSDIRFCESECLRVVAKIFFKGGGGTFPGS